MEFDNIKDILNSYAKKVISDARKNLVDDHKSLGSLYNSLDYKLDTEVGSFLVDFFMEDYGKFQDQGVSGIKVKYNTPFKYTNKMPPAKAFDKWGIKRGIAPRGKGGQFEKRKGLDFALARSIYYKGIKPSMFFTKPFDKAFERLPEEIANSLIKDITENI